MRPAYLNISPEEIASRGRKLAEKLSHCTLCHRSCGVDRASGEVGHCKTAKEALVASFGPHFGEERPLVGSRGSGTVFFAGCNLGCVFCQNADISHYARGRPTSVSELARIYLHIQDLGCHNLNLVTPTHVTPQILEALAGAVDKGFHLPLVWNTGGYDSPEILESLDGIVDIYMPDFKLCRPDNAKRLVGARNYPEVARASIAAMHRQVGDLLVDHEGIAQRGLLIRHLVLPGGLSDTEAVAEFIAGLSPNTYFNLMAQYRPCHLARQIQGIERSLSPQEFNTARQIVLKQGITRLDKG